MICVEIAVDDKADVPSRLIGNQAVLDLNAAATTFQTNANLASSVVDLVSHMLG